MVLRVFEATTYTRMSKDCWPHTKFRLAIIKQGAVVNVVARLSHVLTLGLKLQNELPSIDSTSNPSSGAPLMNHSM